MILSKELFWKLVRFGVVGVLVMGCFMGLNAVFFKVLGLGTYTSFLLAYPLALFVHYFLNKRWTFASKQAASKKEIRDYLMMVIITWVIQSAAFAFFTARWPQLPNWIAAGCASAAQMVFSFLIMQRRVFAPAKEGSGPIDRSGRLRPPVQAATAVLFAAICGLYAWTISPDVTRWRFAVQESDYYNLQVHGFLKGHLYMDLALPPVPPGADGDQLPAGAPSLLDASFHHGHYYLYFGLAPAATVFLPFRLIAGKDLPPAYAVLAFSIAGFALLLVGLAAVRRNYFPSAGGAPWLVAVVLAGLGTAVVVTVRRSLFYEVASTASFAFWAAAFAGIVRATFSARPKAWLAGASLAAALAFASRPNVGIGAALTLPLVAVWLWWHAPAKRTFKGLVAWLFAGGAPALAVVGLVFTYNAARFGSPVDFGHAYQIGSISKGFASATYLWHNLRLYYLTPPALNWYFPFVAPGMEGARPAGYIGVEHAHGEWVFLPLVLILAALWIGVFRLRRRQQTRLIILSSLAWFAGNFLVLCVLSVRANRYMLDFHPALVAVCAIGLFAVAELKVKGRSVLLALAVAWAGVVGLFNIATSFHTQGYTRDSFPAIYRRLGGVANRLAWPLQQLFGREPGPEAFALTFRNVRTGASEPLVFAGDPSFEDELRVEYASPTSARLYLAHGFYGTVRGPLFSFEPGRTYRLGVSLGTFYPPVGHPWYGPVPEPTQTWLRSHSTVTLDGREIFSGDSPTFAGTPPAGTLGVAADFELSDPRFRGDIHRLGPIPVDRQLLASLGTTRGRERLTVRFPRERFGGIDPLLSTGWADAGNRVLVRYDDPAHLTFGFAPAGGEQTWSHPVAIDYDATHVVEIVLWPLRSIGTNEPGIVRSTVEVRLDDHTVFDADLLQHAAPPQEVFVGAAPWPGNGAGTMFGGEILRAERLGVSAEAVAATLNSSPGTSLTVVFPRDRTGGAEPLFSRGAVGEADSLFVRYVSGNSVQLGFDVWSQAVLVSRPVTVNYDRPHRIDVVYGRLLPEGDLNHDRLRVALDGQILIDAPAKFSPTPNARFVAGRNPMGMSTSSAAFTGDLIAVAAMPVARVAATPDPGGRLDLVLRVPEGRSSGADPILESGVTGAADLLYLRYLPGNRIAFGLDRWGSSSIETGSIAIDPAQSFRLEVDYGPLFPANDPRSRRLRVAVNGSVLCDREVVYFPAKPSDVTLARNPLQMSTSVPAFTGSVLSSNAHP